MSDSLFGSLLSMLDKGTVGEVANALGQPEHSVARGMESSIAALLGGLASKSGDPGVLRSALDTVPASAGNVSWSQVAGSIAPGSSLMAAGRQALSTLFGSGETAVTSEIGRESGLPSGTASSLLAMAAPVVMSFLGKQVRDGQMTMSGLGGLLQRETATIRSALPSGLSKLFWPGAATVAAPVVAQAVQKERSLNWLPVLALAALGLGLLWFLSHARRPSIAEVAPPSSTMGTANRLATPVTPVPNVVCTLPSSVVLPEGGPAARLLAFVQNPDTKVGADSWFNMDQIEFHAGSATLRPESQAQLNNIAAVLTSCPSLHLEIAGYTDNVGPAESNVRLSWNRAKAVVSQLVSMGVPPDRLTAKGYGEEFAIADNSSQQGRAQNRRVAIRVTEK